MNKRLITIVAILLFALLLLAFTNLALPPTPSSETKDKIAPHLLTSLDAKESVEFFVILNEKADLSKASRFSAKAEKGRYVYQTLWQTAQTSQAPLKVWLDARGIPYRSFYIVNALLVEGDYDLALTLAKRDDVLRLEANPSIYNDLPAPLLKIEAPRGIAAIEPNITYVNADDVWNLGFTGQGVVVGGQDTGYDWDHPALLNQYRGWNGSSADHDYNWHDSVHSGGGVCGADSLEPCDDHNHGTHTMGTAVGDDGDTNQIGMAPGAKWIGCRNMNQGWGTPETYIECFEFFLAPYPIGATPAEGKPELAPDVTVNSWTCPPSEGCSWDTLETAIEAQRAAGIMTVAAAGNSGSSCSTIKDPPSFYDAAYTIGALNKGSDTLASFSGRGPVTVPMGGSNRRKPDIAAPGTSVRSSFRNGGYGIMSGTSMATPNVAGAVALLWSAAPTLTNNITATENYLNDTAFHISSSACSSSGWPNNLFGYGRLDILAAVKRALLDFNISPPFAAFSYPTPVYSDYPVTFANLTTGTLPITFTWTFGDGAGHSSIGTAFVPVQHTYASTGTYSVGLTTSNAFGESSFKTTLFAHQAGIELRPITVTKSAAYNLPLTYTLYLSNTGSVADTFLVDIGGYDDSGGYEYVTLSLTKTTLTSMAGRPITVSVSFPFSGTLPLDLTLVVTAGLQSAPDLFVTATLTSRFTSMPDHTPPQAAFSYSKPIYVNRAAVFTNLSVGSLPITSTWDFGDNTPVRLISGTAFIPIQHTYTEPGTYTVRLTATNNFGQFVFTDTLTAHQAGLLLAPRTDTRSGPFNIPLTYTLYLTNTGDLTDTFHLNFGGPGDSGWYANASLSLTQTTLSPQESDKVIAEIPFPSFGTLPLHLTVVLTAASQNVPSEIATATLNSIFTPEIPPEPPTAAFTFTTPVYLNQAATFTNLTGGTLPITSTWDFGEGTPPENKGTSLMPVEHTYTTVGTYTVILTASNAFGEGVFSDTLLVSSIQVYLPIVLK